MAAGLKSGEKLLLNKRCERCPLENMSLTDKMQPSHNTTFSLQKGNGN